MATSVASQLAKLRKEREALEKREKALQTRTHTRAIEKILAIAKDAGLSAADISAAMGGGKKKSVKAKYFAFFVPSVVHIGCCGKISLVLDIFLDLCYCNY